MAFVVVEVTGMRTLGPKGYLSTIFYLPHGLPGGIGGAGLKVVLLAVLTPIEIDRETGQAVRARGAACSPT